MAFGLRPLDARAIQGTTEWAFNVNAIAGAKLASGQLVPDPANLDFTRLKALTGGNPTDPPRWVINATAAPSRHLLGWLSQNDIDFDRHIFRMAGDEQCAESVGPIPVGPRSLWDASEPDANLSPLLTAVTPPPPSSTRTNAHWANLCASSPALACWPATWTGAST